MKLIRHTYMEARKYLLPLFAFLFVCSTGAAIAQPLVNLGPDAVLCGGSVTLDAGAGASTYSWSTGASTQTIVVSTSNVYWVDATDGGGTTRDSINLFFLSTPADPVVSDTTLCKADETVVYALSAADEVLWFSDSAGTNLLATGDTITLDVQDTTRIYTQAINLAPAQFVGISSPLNLVYYSDPRGLTFQTYNSLVLKTTRVYTNQPTTFDIRITKGSSNQVYLQSYTLPVAGEYVLPIFANLEANQTYRIFAINIIGALGNTQAGLSFPYTIPGLIDITGDQNNNTTLYRNFYNLEVSSGICSSALVPMDINILPSPTIELGRDTVMCGGTITLDASNPNASYLWSTGATTATLTLSATDTLSVVASIGQCDWTDSIAVTILDNPQAPVLADTTTCRVPFIALSPASPAEQMLWFADSSGNILLSNANPFILETDDSTIIYAQAVNTSGINIGGFQNTPGNLIYFSDNRGIRLRAERDLTLGSSIVYTNQPSSFSIVLQGPNGGAILDSVFIQINSAGSHEVPLYFDLQEGEEYRLMAINISGGLGVTNASLSFPYNSPGFLSVTGDQNNNQSLYRYFFQLRFFQDYCSSPLAPVKINILPTPEIDLGPDTVLCGNTPFTMDASYPGATYLWSTSQTSPTITADTSGLYQVTVSINTCSDTEERELLFIPEPALPIINDTTICSPSLVELGIPSTADLLFWYEDAIGGNFLSRDSLSVEITDTSTYFVASANTSSILSLGANPLVNSSLTTAYRGLTFDVLAPSVVIHEVGVIVGNSTDVIIRLVDASNQILDTAIFRDLQPVLDGGGGLKQQAIPLYFEVPEGTNYKLLGEVLKGSLAFSSSNFSFPYEAPDLLRITSSSNQSTSLYYYFYNWKVSRGICYSPRIPVEITVNLPLNLPPYVYSCSDTLLDAGNLSGSFLWNTGASSQTLPVDSTGLYVLAVDNGLGCIAQDSTFVEIPIDAGLPNDGILCGSSLTTNYDETATFQWSTGDSTSTLPISNPGTYSVIVNEPRGCTVYDTITVTGFENFPVVALGPDFSVCDSAILSPGVSGLSYLWSTGDTTSSIWITASGTYIVTATSNNGCATSDTIGVAITPSPRADFALPDTIVNSSLQVSFVNQSTFGSYTWDLGDGNTNTFANPTHTYSDTGYYCVRLIVNDILGSCGSDTITRCFTLLEYNVGLDKGQEITLRAYPNPSQEDFQVEIPSGLRQVHLSVYDVAGRQMYTQEHNDPALRQLSIPARNWASGIYLLQVRDATGKWGQIKLHKQ